MGQPGKGTLHEVAIFKGLTGSARRGLEHLCTWKKHERGKNIIHAQDITRDVFFLVAGRARVSMYSVAGKPVSFREIGPGDMFGEFAAIDGGPRSTSVEVLETSLVAFLSGTDFKEMLRAQPLVMEAVLVHAVAQIRGLTARVFEFSTLAVNNRIQAELLRLAKAGHVLGRQARISPFPKHGEIASRISTHREAVTRCLNLLEKKKLIQRAGTTLLINDLRELERMVQNATGE
jgi:CRP-like cAMP-binding protein